MEIPARSRLVMIGDSVTDCGRARPVGKGPGVGLGHGYVAQLDTHLRTLYPDAPVRVLNLGISGDTVRDLAARWATDVLALEPDWLSVMIGINDVWRFFDPDPVQQAQAVLPPEFEATYDTLLRRVRPQVQGLVLMTPFFVEPSKADPMRSRMDDYGAIVKSLAARHGARLADTQAAFDRHLAIQPVSALAPDRVHPTEAGHRILAQTFLEAARS